MKRLLIFLFAVLPLGLFAQTMPIDIGSYANDPSADNFRTVATKVNSWFTNYLDSMQAALDTINWIHNDSIPSLRNASDLNYTFISTLDSTVDAHADSITALRSDIGTGGGGGSGDFSYSDTTYATGVLETIYRTDTAKENIRDEIQTYTEGDGIDITNNVVKVGKNISPTDYLNITLGQTEYFNVSNTYGFPPNYSRLRISQDSMLIDVDNGNSSTRRFYMLMTDTDLDLIYDDDDTYTGGGGMEIDTNKVIISFTGTGIPGPNSRLHVQEDSAFISSFNSSDLVTNKVSTSSYGIFIDADSVYFPQLDGTENAWVFITPTGKVDTGTLVAAKYGLEVDMPNYRKWLNDRKDGEIKWPYLENGEIIWKYGINDVKQFQFNIQATTEIILRKQRQQEIHSWVNSFAVALMYVMLIFLFVYIIRTYHKY